MGRFFVTFPAGAGALAKRALSARLPDLEALALLDGAADFITGTPYSQLNLFFCQNIFQVLHSGPDGDLESYLRRLPGEGAVDWAGAGDNAARIRTFRLIVSQGNRLAAGDGAARARLERRIAKKTGLWVDRGSPDTEFWALARREGGCWFLKRLTKRPAAEKRLPPGQLHPEVCYLMAFLSGPRHTDMVLDPFCGGGAIPAERIKRFPYRQALAFDSDPACVERARRLLAGKRGVTVARRDALRLGEALPPASVDAVITDPPWGLYQKLDRPLADFYRQALAAAAAVLKPGGRLVWLTAGREAFWEALGAVPQLALREEHRLLVSGKKCSLSLSERLP